MLEFYEKLIKGNESYEIDEKQNIVLKKYVDGMTEPTDLPTYVKHHLDRI